MRSIELTQKQKDKLLEMCIKLFPDIKWEHYDTANITEKKEYPEVWIVQGVKDDQTFCIHWFEFCSRYITSKLDDLYIKTIINPVDPHYIPNQPKNLKYPDNWKSLGESRPFFTFNDNLNGEYPKRHPVDYLYNEFKKMT